jgi:hypothetical protein
MWDKDKTILNSYMKYDMSKMQNMGIDVEAELIRMVGKELCVGQVDMGEIKEDRRKYLLIRR